MEADIYEILIFNFGQIFDGSCMTMTNVVRHNIFGCPHTGTAPVDNNNNDDDNNTRTIQLFTLL